MREKIDCFLPCGSVEVTQQIVTQLRGSKSIQRIFLLVSEPLTGKEADDFKDCQQVPAGNLTSSETLTRMAEQAKAAGLQMVIHGNPNNISPKTLNIAFPGIDAETMLIMLNMRNVCCSAGSACTAHENAPSHVLTAMGVDPEEARCSIRLSISHTTRHEELEEAVMTIIECASAIKAMQNG